jgi:hypothetical protein
VIRSRGRGLDDGRDAAATTSKLWRRKNGAGKRAVAEWISIPVISSMPVDANPAAASFPGPCELRLAPTELRAGEDDEFLGPKEGGQGARRGTKEKG